MQRKDFLNTLISEKDIRNNLVRIFPDSIILEGRSIAAISDDLARFLEYPAAELIQQPITLLSDEDTFKKCIAELSAGFFEKLIVSLRGKKGNALNCMLSGFQLGLISEINGLVILKVQPLDESLHLTKQLEASRCELDEFVYRTTHDLRGPLATMQGLINLMMLESDGVTEDMKGLISMIAKQAHRLDERLFNLSYLSETIHPRKTDNTLDCYALESILRSTLEQNLMLNKIDFLFTTDQRYFSNLNAQLTIATLNHLLLYLINLPQSEAPKVTYSIRSFSRGMQVTICADGFISNYQLRQAIERKDPLYTNIITYADLISFFAAMKDAQYIRASIHVDQIEETQQKITVVIPAG